MKKYIFYLLICLIALPLQAKNRTETERLYIVQQHFANRAPVSTRSTGSIELAATSSQVLGTVTTRAAAEAFYIYNYGESAFVIISGDDSMKPVLGYSDNSHFVTENLPANLKGWLSLYAAPAIEEPQQKQPLCSLNKKETSPR